MLAAMVPTPSGTWFHYRWRDLRLAAHATLPGTSGLTVLWKGNPAVDDLGTFFERAAIRVRTPAPYVVWIINSAEVRPHRVDHVVPIPPELLAEAQFVRFECRPETEAGESPLIVWANLDREASPDQESIGVYLREQDLPNLEEDLSAIVVRTAVRSPQTRFSSQIDLEREVRVTLAHLASDLREAAQTPAP
jgi:hypothetical protein